MVLFGHSSRETRLSGFPIVCSVTLSLGHWPAPQLPSPGERPKVGARLLDTRMYSTIRAIGSSWPHEARRNGCEMPA